MKLKGVVAALVIGLGCGGNGEAPGGSGQGGVNGAAGTGVAGTSPSAGTSGSAGTNGAAGTSAAGTNGAAGTTAAAGTGAAGTSSTGAAGTAPASDGGAGSVGLMGGGDGGAPSASCEGRLVCDDFEKAALGGKPSAPFVVRAGKGTVTVDATRARSGKQSVKVAITATATGDTYRQAMLAVTGAPLIPLPNNHVYGRFFIYTDRIPDKSVHWTIAHGDGPVGTLTGTYNYGGMGGLMANYYRNTTTPGPTDCWQTKNTAFPTGRWVCVGFEYDGGATEMRFSLDGAEVPELHVLGLTKTDATCTVKGVDGRWLAPTFKNISVGWESYQHDVAGAHDAWIDDVVLDDQPVACP